MGLAFTLDSDAATASSAHYRGDTSRCARDISTACLVPSRGVAGATGGMDVASSGDDDDDDRKMMR